MPFELRRAVRENVPLLIGLAGGTGSGKTYSALRLAQGLAGDQPVALIDTECGRSKAYADEFKFDIGELPPPYRPQRYAEAIRDVDQLKKFPVIIVDSASHEWDGDGGLLDWHEEELYRMAGDDPRKREACNYGAWREPKAAHKQFRDELIYRKSHLILCLRAETKTEMVKQNDKWVIQPKHGFLGMDGWFPICEKKLPFELTIYFLFLPEDPGVPHPIKPLMPQHRPFFDLTRPICEENGKRLAEWARGAKARTLSNDELKDLEINIQEAKTEEELKTYGERCRLAPAFEQGRLRDLYVAALEKLRGGKVSP